MAELLLLETDTLRGGGGVPFTGATKPKPMGFRTRGWPDPLLTTSETVTAAPLLAAPGAFSMTIPT